MVTKTTMVLMKRDEPDLAQILERQLAFREPRTPNKVELVKATREFESNRDRVVGDLQQMFHALDRPTGWYFAPIDIRAEIGSLSLEEARQQVRQQLQEAQDLLEARLTAALQNAARANAIGRIEWFGRKACRFHYFDQERSRTLTAIKTKTVQHTHDLIKARKHRWPANDVRKPKRCEELIKNLPPWLAEHSYIVTGTVIRPTISQVAERVEANEVIRAARWLGDRMKVATRAVSQGARSVAKTIEEGARRQFSEIRMDPALVVGNEFVLCGWLE
jgi:hypothetical protein